MCTVVSYMVESCTRIQSSNLSSMTIYLGTCLESFNSSTLSDLMKTLPHTPSIDMQGPKYFRPHLHRITCVKLIPCNNMRCVRQRSDPDILLYHLQFGSWGNWSTILFLKQLTAHVKQYLPPVANSRGRGPAHLHSNQTNTMRPHTLNESTHKRRPH